MSTLYTLAASPDLALVHTGLLEAMVHHGETPQYLAGVPIGFFSYEPVKTCDHCGATWSELLDVCDDCGAILPDDSEIDLLKIDALIFAEAIARGVAFTYERHTVRENGVSQIILTLSEGA